MRVQGRSGALFCARLIVVLAAGCGSAPSTPSDQGGPDGTLLDVGTDAGGPCADVECGTGSACVITSGTPVCECLPGYYDCSGECTAPTLDQTPRQEYSQRIGVADDSLDCVGQFAFPGVNGYLTTVRVGLPEGLEFTFAANILTDEWADESTGIRADNSLACHEQTWAVGSPSTGSGVGRLPPDCTLAMCPLPSETHLTTVYLDPPLPVAVGDTVYMQFFFDTAGQRFAGTISLDYVGRSSTNIHGDVLRFETLVASCDE